MTTLKEHLHQTASKLKVEQSILEARLLLQFLLKLSPEQFFLKLYDNVNIDTNKLEALIFQRNQGQPMAYILGVQEFYGIPIYVTKDVLVPRVDTETIIDILQEMPSYNAYLDIGTGSGAIATAIAKTLQPKMVLASDISKAAAKVAYKNLSKNIIISDLLAAIKPNSFDVIVANLPYIDPNDTEHLSKLTFEPKLALTALNHGLALIYKIIIQAKKILKPDGFIVLEHGFNQHLKVQSMLALHDFYAIKTCLDLGANPRVTYARLKKRDK